MFILVEIAYIRVKFLVHEYHALLDPTCIQHTSTAVLISILRGENMKMYLSALLF